MNLPNDILFNYVINFIFRDGNAQKAGLLSGSKGGLFTSPYQTRGNILTIKGVKFRIKDVESDTRKANRPPTGPQILILDEIDDTRTETG